MKHKVFTPLLFAFLTIAYSCQGPGQPKNLTPEEQAKFISTGKEITSASFKALSGEVMKGIQEGGVQHAVGYCHLQASQLIDSLSGVYDAKINRVSDKYRNPANKPGDLDLTILESYRKHLSEGAELQPHLEITADEIIYYSPILLANPACLLCHGEPGSTMDNENYNFIKSRYPEDQAVNYQIGELRGVWKIILSSEF